MSRRRVHIVESSDEDEEYKEETPPEEKTISEKASVEFMVVFKQRLHKMKDTFITYSVHSSVALGCYCFGYMGVHVAWLMLGAFGVLYFVEKSARRKEQLRVEMVKDRKLARRANQNNDFNIDTCLPKWTSYPDVESMDWMNRFLTSLWPRLDSFLKDMLGNKVQPEIRKASVLLANFTFSHMDLGDQAPQILGIKHYRQGTIADNKYMMDIQLIFDSTCNLGVSVNFLSAGICDFIFRGLMRVEFEPLLDRPPFIGALGVSFVEDPVVDFDLTNLLNLLDLPGFESLLRGTIRSVIANMMVYPNKMLIKLDHSCDISVLKYPWPEGVLRIHVIKARNLLAKDFSMFSSNTSDPYVKMTVRSEKKESKVVAGTCDPEWNEAFDFMVGDMLHTQVDIEVWDHDAVGSHDFLGKLCFPAKKVFDYGVIQEWQKLSDVEQGEIFLRLQWMEIVSNGDYLNDAMQEVCETDSTSPTILSVFIREANELPKSGRGANKGGFFSTWKKTKDCSESKVMVKCQMPGIEAPFTTNLVPFKNAVWEKRFITAMKNPFYGFVRFEVEADVCEEKMLGKAKYKVSNLLQKSDLLTNTKIKLKESGPNTTLDVTIALKVLKSKKQRFPEDVPQASAAGAGGGSKKVEEDAETVKAAEESEEDILDDEENDDDSISVMTNDHNRSPSIASMASVMSDGAYNRMKHQQDNKPDNGKGRVMVTIRCQQKCLSVLVVKAENLIICDEDNKTSDPYVKITVIDEGMTKKTKHVNKSLNPCFDQLLQFNLSNRSTVPGKCKLKISVKNHKGFMSSEKAYMGTVGIDLQSIPDLTVPHTRWYALE